MGNNDHLPALMQEFNLRLCEGFLREKDKALIAALADKGFPVDEEFVKGHMQLITLEEYPEFEHYWYHFGQADAVRIISFEREPQCNLVQPDFPINNWKQTIEAKYYYK
jgi:hypothetical protein